MKVLIAGGGIGGLALALSLHQKGIACEVFERSSEIRELGVGINTLPHAIKELTDLGLLEALDQVAIRTYELIYQNRLGQEIWRDLRGLHAGFEYPQFSIHRGRLQGVLHQAALERMALRTWVRPRPETLTTVGLPRLSTITFGVKSHARRGERRT